MMKLIVYPNLVWVLICFTLPLNAQKTNTLKEVHRQENTDTGHFGNHSSPYIALPDWFVSFDAQNQEQYYVAGISDPFLDSAEAVMQATQRACALASLMQKCHQREMSTIFEKSEKYSSKRILVLASFTVFENVDTRLEYNLERITILSSGEAIVLIVPGKGSSVFDSKLRIEFMARMDEFNSIYDITAAADWKLISPAGHDAPIDESSVLQYNEVLADKQTERRMKYFSANARDCLTKGDSSAIIPGFRTTAGLWTAYLTAFLNNMINVGWGDAKVKSLHDRYNDSETSLLEESRELERSVSIDRVGFCKKPYLCASSF